MKVFRKLDVDMLLKMEPNKLGYDKKFICEHSSKLFLSNLKNWFFTCIKDNEVIAFAFGYELQRLDDKENILYIHSVATREDKRRQGIMKCEIHRHRFNFWT